MSRTAFVFLSITIAVFAVTQLAPGAAQSATGSIEGIVTRSGTSEPIAGVAITLSGGANAGISQAAAQAIVDNAIGRGVAPPPDLLNTALDGTPNFFFQPGVNGATGSPFSRPTTTTDSVGHFIIPNLAPGPYAIRAQRDGYLGPSTAGGIAANVIVRATVSAQQISRVALALTPGATISGRVVNASGAPLVSRGVSALRISYVNGTTSLASVSGGGPGRGNQTNDRGEYRIFSLPPGEYLIAANPEPQGDGPRGPVYAVGKERPVQTFYPAATDMTSATAVVAKAGEEVRDINIRIRTAPMVRISGRVESDFALPAAAAAPAPRGARGPTATIRMQPRDSNTLFDPNVNFGATVLLGPPNDGSFEIVQAIPPGVYDLYASTEDSLGYGPGPTGAGQLLSYGHSVIDVGAQGASNLRITIHRGVELKGRVTVDGKPSASAGAQLLLQPVDGSNRIPHIQVASRLEYKVGADGSFTIPAVPEAQYRIQVGVDRPPPVTPARGQIQTVFMPLPDGYIADVLVGGVSVSESGIAVGNAQPPPIEIVVKTDSGSVEGTAIGSDGKPAAGATVLLAPLLARRADPFLFKSATSDRNGHYSFANVAPGDYKLFAWDVIEYRAYEVPEFLNRYESQGEPVRIAPSRGTSAEVRVILN